MARYRPSESVRPLPISTDLAPLESSAKKSTVAPATGTLFDFVTVPTTARAAESWTTGSGADAAPGAGISSATIFRGSPVAIGGTISTRYWPASPTIVNDPVASVADADASRPVTRRSGKCVAVTWYPAVARCPSGRNTTAVPCDLSGQTSVNAPPDGTGHCPYPYSTRRPPCHEGTASTDER